MVIKYTKVPNLSNSYRNFRDIKYTNSGSNYGAFWRIYNEKEIKKTNRNQYQKVNNAHLYSTLSLPTQS